MGYALLCHTVWWACVRVCVCRSWNSFNVYCAHRMLSSVDRRLRYKQEVYVYTGKFDSVYAVSVSRFLGLFWVKRAISVRLSNKINTRVLAGTGQRNKTTWYIQRKNDHFRDILRTQRPMETAKYLCTSDKWIDYILLFCWRTVGFLAYCDRRCTI